MRKVIALLAVGVGGVLTASPESGVEAALLRPCTGTVVGVADGQPVGCDVQAGQVLVVIGMGAVECADSGGRHLELGWGITACVDVDY